MSKCYPEEFRRKVLDLVASAPGAMSCGTAGHPSGSSTDTNEVRAGSARIAHFATWKGARPALTTLTPTTNCPPDGN